MRSRYGTGRTDAGMLRHGRLVQRRLKSWLREATSVLAPPPWSRVTHLARLPPSWKRAYQSRPVPMPKTLTDQAAGHSAIAMPDMQALPKEDWAVQVRLINFLA